MAYREKLVFESDRIGIELSSELTVKKKKERNLKWARMDGQDREKRARELWRMLNLNVRLWFMWIWKNSLWDHMWLDLRRKPSGWTWDISAERPFSCN